MNEPVIRSIKQVVVVIVIVAGVTLNTVLLKGAGNSSDILTMAESVELNKSQTEDMVRRHREYIEARVSKAEERQDSYYNILNRRVDIIENKYSRVENSLLSSTTINNNFTPTQTTIINPQQ